MSDLIEKCKLLKIDYINNKTNKPYGKPALLKRIQEIEEKVLITEQPLLIEYKNEIIWSCTENKEYNDYERKLLNLIKKCHDILYSNGSIVGTDASNDIIKILILRFINIIYKTNDGKEKIDKLMQQFNKPLQERFMPYIIDFTQLLKIDNGNYENELKVYIKVILSIILPDVFTGEDGFLNTRDEPENIYKIITEISTVIDLENTNISNYFSTQGGNIYEYFTNGYGKGNNTSKDLGQFFTPFNLIQAILYGCGFNDLIRTFENSSLYDPCCGSGGLLCITYKNNKDFINSNQIYGCEVEKKTIKYALASSILNTNELNTNILNTCSLSKNPYIFTNKKFDIIFTNPPFGIKNSYKEKKKLFEEFRDRFYNGNPIKFEDVYPLNINDGTIMFIQLVIYLLNINGVCAIVLPDGKIMDNYKLRKFIIDKCKILKIINVDSGTFGHTTIKTKVIIFKKMDNDGNNDKSIEFLEINKKGNEVKLITVCNLNKNYSFNLEKETKEVIEYSGDIEIKKLGDICNIDIGGTPLRNNQDYYLNGTNLWVSVKELNNNYIYDTKEKITDLGVKKSNVKLLPIDTILLSFKLSIGKIAIAGKELYTNEAIAGINTKDNSLILNKYLYYYLQNTDLSIYATGLIGNGSLNKESLKSIEIPIPLLEKQEEIVEYFDEFFKDKDIKLLSNYINNKFNLIFRNFKQFNKNITMLYNLNKSDEIIQQSIDSIKNTNNDIIEITLNNNDFENIKLSDLIVRINNYIDIEDDIQYNIVGLSSKGYTKISKQLYGKNIQCKQQQLCKKDNFIISKILNGCYGIIDDITNNCIISSEYWLFNINTNIVSKKYIYIIFKEIIINNLNDISSGLGIPRINKEKFNLMEIPIPSLEVQEEIVNKIDNNDVLIKNLEKMIEDNKELMKKIFN